MSDPNLFELEALLQLLLQVVVAVFAVVIVFFLLESAPARAAVREPQPPGLAMGNCLHKVATF